MDYEKKYKEALERARQFSEKPYLEDSKGIVDYIFPELQESEDERIKKAIKYGLDYVFTNNTTVYETTKEQCLAWLEKQGEQKSAWSEEDEELLNTIINHFKVNVECTDDDDIIKWLKSLKDKVQPKQEWSEEDNKMLNGIIYAFQHGWSPHGGQIDWLKSLRPQNWTKEDKERYISCLQRF